MSLYPDLWRQPRALVILKIIYDLGRPAQLHELVSLTGGDDETVSKYCSRLAGMGLLTRVSGHAGWTLTANGMTFLSPNAASGVETHHIPSLRGIPVNYPESTLSTTTKYSHDSRGVVVESPKTVDYSGNDGAGSGFYSENMQFFATIGITCNQQTDFIARKLSPKVIRAEWKKLEDKGKAWPGLLIKILTHLPEPKHPYGCRCDQCRANRKRAYEPPPF